MTTPILPTSTDQFEKALLEIYNIFYNEYDYRMSEDFTIKLKEQIEQIHLNPSSDQRLHELFKKITNELDRLQELLTKIENKKTKNSDI